MSKSFDYVWILTLFVIMALSCLPAQAKPYTEAEKKMYVECTPRNAKTPKYCFVPTKNPPKTKTIATVNAVGMGVGGIIAAHLLAFTLPESVLVGTVVGGITYFYIDSFKGPVYESNERRFADEIKSYF